MASADIANKLIDDIWAKYPEHNTDSDYCWCEPTVIFTYPESGDVVILHRDFV